MSQHDPTNVMVRRVVAYLIDALLVSAVAGLLFFSSAEVIEDVGSGDLGSAFCDLVTETEAASTCFVIGDDAYLLTGSDSVQVWVASLAVGFLSFVVLTALTGASVGKLAMGLRVVDGQGRRCSFGKAVVRWALLIVDGLCLVGFFVAAFTHPHRRIGDMAAGTYVVAKGSVGQPIGAPATAPPADYAAQPGAWQPPPGPPT